MVLMSLAWPQPAGGLSFGHLQGKAKVLALALAHAGRDRKMDRVDRLEPCL